MPSSMTFNSVNGTAEGILGTLRDWFYCVLRIYSYLSLATKKAELGELSRQYSSLEDIHDVIHDYGGGNFSNMAARAVGAFDPTLWLHHKLGVIYC